MDDNKLLPKLSQNLLEILDDNEYCDITIEVGNNPYVKIFHAHTIILYYRSPYLKRILSTNKTKNDGILTHVKLPNILPEIFQIILRYIYGGRISLKEYDTSDIIKILVAASELSLQELTSYVQSFLIENNTNWIKQNFNLIYQTSFENDSFVELQKYCIDIISEGSDEVLKLLDLSSMPEKILISIIKNDNLQMSEIQVWEHVLKWGLAQNPGLPSDITNYSKDDFDTLRNTLQQHIPFIKFYNLTSKEFLDKVSPYEKLFSEEFYKNLIETFINILEIKSRTFDSKIITYQHAELILKWIDRLEITDKLTSPYKFKLLFRASCHKFDRGNFHYICDNKSRTVTIVKVKDSDEILGGYNPIGWKSDIKYGITRDSFIFSFKNKYRIENHILSRVIDKNSAILNGSYFGPSFGKSDLIIWKWLSGNSCSKASYEKPIRNTTNEFFVEECEVFQIVN